MNNPTDYPLIKQVESLQEQTKELTKAVETEVTVQNINEFQIKIEAIKNEIEEANRISKLTIPREQRKRLYDKLFDYLEILLKLDPRHNAESVARIAEVLRSLMKP